MLLGGFIAASSSAGNMHLGLVAMPGFIVAILFLFVKVYKTAVLWLTLTRATIKIKMEREGYGPESSFLSHRCYFYLFWNGRRCFRYNSPDCHGYPTYFATEYE
ncbi:MAG: hypothetical protein MZV63_29605 [Marinilabiliales bacterium]|nr:hypothetical protein [Marinilabiliales bacterium]